MVTVRLSDTLGTVARHGMLRYGRKVNISKVEEESRKGLKFSEGAVLRPCVRRLGGFVHSRLLDPEPRRRCFSSSSRTELFRMHVLARRTVASWPISVLSGLGSMIQ